MTERNFYQELKPCVINSMKEVKSRYKSKNKEIIKNKYLKPNDQILGKLKNYKTLVNYYLQSIIQSELKAIKSPRTNKEESEKVIESQRKINSLVDKLNYYEKNINNKCFLKQCLKVLKERKSVTKIVG